MSEINPTQITFARVRRRVTKAQLAQALDLASRSVQNYESGVTSPDQETLEKLAAFLRFPVAFFYREDEPPAIHEHAVSFRKLSKMTEAMKACTYAAGAIAFQLNAWIEARFTVPASALPDLSDLDPEDAAASLRRMWGLGNGPIPNMVHLLESKGIRVFSLAEETRDVDAFCTWHENKPFVFLNTMKSAERSRFDAAHELGHLVRDVYSMRHGEAQAVDIERKADAFASAFLMPRQSVEANQPPVYTIPYLMTLKHYWGVSLAAVAYRFHALGLVSEWNYRTLCIEIAKRGYRTTEPDPMERETSQLLTKVFEFLASKKQGRRDIAEAMSLHIDEVNALTFQLTPLSVVSGSGGSTPSGVGRQTLRLVR